MLAFLGDADGTLGLAARLSLCIALWIGHYVRYNSLHPRARGPQGLVSPFNDCARAFFPGPVWAGYATCKGESFTASP